VLIQQQQGISDTLQKIHAAALFKRSQMVWPSIECRIQHDVEAYWVTGNRSRATSQRCYDMMVPPSVQLLGAIMGYYFAIFN
jgi:hypothetical protein